MTNEHVRDGDAAGKATPGPWWTDARYDGREMGCAVIAARTDCGPMPGNPTRGMVAFVTVHSNLQARECEANARLIAAAPTMRSLLIEAVEDMEREIGETLDPMREHDLMVRASNIRGLLSKVDGQE
jgi:hypothetical protein